jgi:hypothetical protein
MTAIADSEPTIARRFLTRLGDSKGQKYTIKGRPNPPDFLLSVDEKESWLELSDIYLNNAQARFLNSSNEKVLRFSGSPDETALRMFNKLNEKVSKLSYKNVFEKLGPGILLLTCQDMVFDSVNLSRMEEGLHSFAPFGDRGFFARVYFEYLIDAQRFYRVVYPRDEALASVPFL